MGNFVDEYFSIVALMILFRETLEASIIVAVLLQFLARSFPHLKKQVWWGVAAGAFGSVIFGVIFSVLFYVAKENVFKGSDREIFKGCIAWFAAILMTILAFAMLRYKGWEDKIQRKLEKLAAEELEKQQRGDVEEPTSFRERVKYKANQGCNKVGDCCLASGTYIHNSTVACWAGTMRGCRAALQIMPCAALRPSTESKGSNSQESELVGSHADVVSMRSHGVGIFLVVFTSVLREGMESVLFLAGVGNSDPVSLILPGIVGFIIGCLAGVFLYYSGKQVKDIKWFVIIMAVILFFIAAGQIMLGTLFLTNGGMFGYASVWQNDRPWYMQPQWDISSCCAITDADSQTFFVLARATVGFQDKPTFVQVVIYFGYWAIVIAAAIYKWFTGSLFDADYKHKREMKKQEKEQARLDAQMMQQLELAGGADVATLAKKLPVEASTDLDSHTTGSNSPARGGTASDMSAQGLLAPSAPPHPTGDLHMQPPVQQSARQY